MTASRGVAGARLVVAAPWVFVLFWSTGFIVARYGTDDAAPLTFLTIRLVIAAAVLGVVAVVSGAPRLDRVALRWASLAGVGLHALYLGGVFVAISWGMPSGVSALIAGLHPVLTTAVARVVLHERVARLQWIGVALGVGGVSVVVIERLAVGSTGGVTVGGLIASAISVLGMVAAWMFAGGSIGAAVVGFVLLLAVVIATGALLAVTTARGKHAWHELVERRPLAFTVLVLLAVLVGGVAELVPGLVIEKQVPYAANGEIAVKPYTALELAGRDLYVREGCYTCHSQMIRPFRSERLRYGDPSRI